MEERALGRSRAPTSEAGGRSRRQEQEAGRMQMRLQVAREPAQEVKEVAVCGLLLSLLSRQEAVGRTERQKPMNSSVGTEGGVCLQC